MPSTVQLRDDYDAAQLRGLAKRCRDPRQIRRLLALAAVYDGMSRAAAAKVGGMDRQTLRDWVHRFNVEGPESLTDRSRAGRPSQLTDAQMEQLAEIVETGPDPVVDGVVRRRRIDLKRVIEERFRVVYAERTISDLLARLSFSYISGRPQHPRQDRQVLEAFTNFSRTLAAHIGHLPKEKPIEIWFQDEARLGQKNSRTRIPDLGQDWHATAPAGRPALRERLSVRRDLSQARQRCRPHAAQRQYPRHAMHLDEISRNVAARAHAVILMDRAGWHKTDKLKLPKNLTIILLPSCSPELNPVENVWQYLRQNWLSNSVFEDSQAILDAGCNAWNRLIAKPETIMSIDLREWAHAGQ